MLLSVEDLALRTASSIRCKEISPVASASTRLFPRIFRSARPRVALLLIVLQIGSILVATAPTAHAATHVSGTIGTQTWTLANSPYIVDGSVTFSSGATLTIEPGVVVKFNGLRSLIVNGTLKAVGNASTPIIFTSIQDDSVGGDDGGDGPTSGSPGQWSRIELRSGTASELKYVEVHYGANGSSNSAYGAVEVDNGATATIAHATFKNNQRSGLTIGSGSGATVQDSFFTNNGNGISTSQGWLEVTRTTLSNQSGDGLWFNLTSTYSGKPSSVTESDVKSNQGIGVRIQVGSSTPSSKMPHGNWNNIYDNTGLELNTGLTNRLDLDWESNYWGSDVNYAGNAGGCMFEGKFSPGWLRHGATTEGPVSSGTYSSGSNICKYNRVDVAPFYQGYLDDMTIANEQLAATCKSEHAPENICGTQDDPVNSATGHFGTEITDLALPGIGVPFELRRTYDSGDATNGPLGPGWTHAYAVFLEIKPHGDVLLHGESHEEIRFIKQADGSFVGAGGAYSTLVKVTGGYDLTRRDQVVYRFDDGGKLLSIKDRNNQGVTLAYGGDAILDTVTDSAGRVITFTHTSGLLTNVALPDGRDVSYTYTGGRLTSVTDVRDNPISYTYQAQGWLEKIIDQNVNTIVTNVYAASGDSAGRVTSQTNARGHTSYFSWNRTTQTSTLTDQRGNTWKDVYDNGILVERIDPEGDSTKFTYDAEFKLVKMTDPKLNDTTMTYDANGNMASITAPAPLSYTQTMTYNADNDITSYKDGRGNITNFEYDASGNLDLIRQPGNVITDIHRQAGTGLIDWIQDPRGKTTNFEYTNGNLTAIIRPSGAKTTMGYDGSGRMTSLMEARGNEPGATPADYTWTFGYDAANHLTSKTSPLGHTTTWSYDPAGNLDFTKDAKLRVTDYQYFPNNLLKKVIPPGTPANETVYDYDLAGNLISRTDANSRVTTYGYNTANLLDSVVLPQGQTWSNTYDKNSNVKTVVNPEGNNTTGDPNDSKITYDYDEVNRLKSIDYSDSTPDLSFTFDANSNRTTMLDGGGSESYSYDPLNRLTSVTRGSQSFAYDYNGSSDVTKRTYPDGTVVDYTYTDDGYLDTVTSGGTNLADYGYNVAGLQTSLALPAANGHIENRSYDRSGRLESIENIKGATTLSRFTYILDELGNPTRITDKDGGIVSFVYDTNRDFLAEVCYQASCAGASDPYIRYEYDGVGNRKKEIRPSVTTEYFYDASDRLQTTTASGQTTTYSWDGNGNMTGAGNRSFTYDLANRTLSTTDAGQTVTYSYDGDGKRLSGTVSGQSPSATTYVWDINWPLNQLIRESDGSGSLRRRYIHGNDLISMTSGGADYFFHHDRLGSVTNITSSAGAEQWTYIYEPFGSLRSSTMVDPGAPPNLMRFTGGLFDSETAQYHLRARQYDSALGRFTAIDPLPPNAFDPYVSAYIYVNNRPTVLVDPTGMTGFGLDGQHVENIAEAIWDGIKVVGHDLAKHAGEATRDTLDFAECALYVYAVGQDLIATLGFGTIAVASIVSPIPGDEVAAIPAGAASALSYEAFERDRVRMQEECAG
jgi:RHS repeat-associated protein